MKERKEIGLRLPMDLYEKVKRTADAKQMNVTQFIVTTLNAAMDAPTTKSRLDGIEEQFKRIEVRVAELGSIKRVVFNIMQRLRRLEALGHWDIDETYPGALDEETKEQD